jgi:glutamate/tyrosine decarboxylase-like PLP-dependent enzyme
MSARLGGLASKPRDLDTPPEFAPSAWFLGPNGENLDVLKTLIVKALDEHADARKSYKDRDPDMAAGRGPDFEATVEAMEKNLAEILTRLRGSIPLSSHRNQSHMYWDITMPGAAGYFAGMLYNQNNVAAEASPITTAMEIGVARDLCRMLGFKSTEEVQPWGHITCDGSVANLEAMWSARNLKYHAAALARAIRVMPELEDAQSLVVNKPDGTLARLMDLDVWELLNLEVDEILSLEHRIVSDHKVEESAVQAAIDRFSFRALGAAGFDREVLLGAVPPQPVVLVPATAHYSWHKAATILGMGTDTIWEVPVNLDGRMIVSELRARLDKCLEEQRPVLQVVNVLGTTMKVRWIPWTGC